MKSVKYIKNDDMKTRGDEGEIIQFGVMDDDNYIYIWDSTYGFFVWGKYDPEFWKIGNDWKVDKSLVTLLS